MTSLRQRVTEDMQVRNLAPNTQLPYLQPATDLSICPTLPQVT